MLFGTPRPVSRTALEIENRSDADLFPKKSDESEVTTETPISASQKGTSLLSSLFLLAKLEASGVGGWAHSESSSSPFSSEVNSGAVTVNI
ncbi:unnamed protein product [Coffea canephora]|uniref:Uncharacterized protein n=1 Tax=Coffea canephora TaxID=49390 RepID=A0A068UH73_COFCA|nr:unnamed protein product [Coffea canephora]